MPDAQVATLTPEQEFEAKLRASVVKVFPWLTPRPRAVSRFGGQAGCATAKLRSLPAPPLGRHCL
jgi:hypothetical protein